MRLKVFPIISISVLLLASSCSDFLDLNPKDKKVEGTFFSSKDEMTQAVTAAYVPLRDLVDNDIFTGEGRSDNVHYEFTNNSGSAIVYRNDIYNFTNGPEDTYVNAVYFHCYKGISRANIVIDKLANTKLSQEDRNHIDGQAKFLRAFFYYKLVRCFGGVPIYLHEITDADKTFVSRSSVDDVYKLIVSDAQAAVDELEAPKSFPQSGEATKGSATILLADVYITLKNYAEAEKLLKTLPQMGYGLLPDYADAFALENKNSKESLFEIQYKQGLQGGQQSNFIYKFLPRSKNTLLITGVATNNSSIGGWNVPTQDLIDAYEPGDKRKSASIAVAEGKYGSDYYFTFSANVPIENYISKPDVTGVPYIKKYLHPHTDPNNTDDNWPVYRYSEALLFLAEALNEQQKTAEAETYLNQVRARAGLQPVTTSSQSELRDAIFKERRVELAFENKRWYDLLRSGKAIEIMTAFGKKQKEKYSYLTSNTYQIDQHNLLYPLPFSEVEMNPDLKQNPGY